jgi:metal-responsive CopG/Arc/MetJ family transcriptional regulator
MTKVTLSFMKIAISVPNDVFELSEKLAKKLKVSRSKIFAMGVKKLAEEYDEEELTARVNAVGEKVDTSLDPSIKKYQSRIIKREKW